MNLILIETGLVIDFIWDSASFHFKAGTLKRHNPKRKDHWAISLKFREVSMSSCSEQFPLHLLFRVSANEPDLK